MKNRLALRHRLVWFALAMLGVLLLLPATRLLLGTQMHMEALDYTTERDPSMERAVALQRPHDYPIQLALASDVPALSTSESAPNARPTAASKARNDRIQALTLRFPDQPSVYANLLRYMTFADVKMWHGEGAVAASSLLPIAPSPESLAMFGAAARKGAELDPDNAYFPTMQAVGLFAAHRDSEALDALKAASRCTQWKEYYQDDIDGRMHLQSAAYGERLAAEQMSSLYALPFPQYAQMRAAARAAVRLAADDERAGKTAEGIAIRHALMRCGGLMRAQGTSLIAPLVGIAIANIATSNPGGLDGPSRPDTGKSKAEESQQVGDQRIAARRNRYYAYLESQGQGTEVAWAKTEIKAGDQAKAILLAANNNPVNSGWRSVQFSASWLVNLVLLFSALVVLMLGVMAHHARLGTPRTDWERKILPVGRGGYALAAIGCIGFWQWAAVCNGLSPCIAFYNLYSDTSSVGSGSDAEGKLAAVQFLVLGLSLLIPVLFVGLIAAFSRRQRVPLAIGLGRGLRGAAIPIAAALFLVYGVSLLPTACLESILKTDIARTSHNEPQYFAEIAHKAWPGDPQP